MDPPHFPIQEKSIFFVFAESAAVEAIWRTGQGSRGQARSLTCQSLCLVYPYPSPPFLLPFPRTSVIKLPPARETGADIESGKTFAKAKIKNSICNDHCFFPLQVLVNKFDKLVLNVWRIFLPDLPPAPPLLPSSNESPEPEEEWKRLCRKGQLAASYATTKEEEGLNPAFVRPFREGEGDQISLNVSIGATCPGFPHVFRGKKRKNVNFVKKKTYRSAPAPFHFSLRL